MNKLFALCSVSMLVLLINTSVVNAEGFNVEAKYAQSCAVCHNSGVAGAPRKGHTKVWAQLLAKGEDALVGSVKKGLGAMPAGGMCADCSDDQLKELITYMSK